jgi:hypothetical protein
VTSPRKKGLTPLLAFSKVDYNWLVPTFEPQNFGVSLPLALAPNDSIAVRRYLKSRQGPITDAFRFGRVR